MKLRTFVIAAVFVFATAVAGFAQLSMAKADWAQGPVKYLMTRDEQAQWNALKSDADADQFIALFWARRDPTPNTPENEFKEAFDQRVAYADQHFGTARQKGSLTDRGRVLILFGP
ncbi:MAG TPA: GWxTD domain-containing protein, partial [Thermoanaerobaculia bacterium]|nr:GWxTD domain-containing protein [Thermoanaerobaculia bacterium]